MGMAYTKASRMVKTAEASFGFPLTERTIGGVGGGAPEQRPVSHVDAVGIHG